MMLQFTFNCFDLCSYYNRFYNKIPIANIFIHTDVFNYARVNPTNNSKK